jgi:hypothetical protein
MAAAIDYADGENKIGLRLTPRKVMVSGWLVRKRINNHQEKH